jgi:hypothetical protein
MFTRAEDGPKTKHNTAAGVGQEREPETNLKRLIVSQHNSLHRLDVVGSSMKGGGGGVQWERELQVWKIQGNMAAIKKAPFSIASQVWLRSATPATRLLARGFLTSSLVVLILANPHSTFLRCTDLEHTKVTLDTLYHV